VLLLLLPPLLLLEAVVFAIAVFDAVFVAGATRTAAGAAGVVAACPYNLTHGITAPPATISSYFLLPFPLLTMLLSLLPFPLLTMLLSLLHFLLSPS
jgi:hypothetical protein